MSGPTKLVAEIHGRTLLVHNRGGGDAREIRVEIEGEEVGESPLVRDGPSDYSELSPVDPPYEFELIPLTHADDNPLRINVGISWEHGAGEPGMWSRELRRHR